MPRTEDTKDRVDTSGALETPGQRKRPRPSLKPPNSAGQAQKKKRMSVKFADTADIRLIYQRAMNHSPTSKNGTTSSPTKFVQNNTPHKNTTRNNTSHSHTSTARHRPHVEEHEDMWFEMDSGSRDDDDDDSSRRSTFVAQKSVEMSLDTSVAGTSRGRPSAPLSTVPTLSQVANMYDSSMAFGDESMRAVPGFTDDDDDDDDDDANAGGDSDEYCGSISMTTDDSGAGGAGDSQYVTTVIPRVPSLGTVIKFYEDEFKPEDDEKQEEREPAGDDSSAMEVTAVVPRGAGKVPGTIARGTASAAHLVDDSMEVTTSAVFRSTSTSTSTSSRSPRAAKTRTTPGSSGKKRRRRLSPIVVTESQNASDAMEMTEVVRVGAPRGAPPTTAATAAQTLSRAQTDESPMELTDVSISTAARPGTAGTAAGTAGAQDAAGSEDMEVDGPESTAPARKGAARAFDGDGDGDGDGDANDEDEVFEDLDLSNEPTILSASAWARTSQMPSGTSTAATTTTDAAAASTPAAPAAAAAAPAPSQPSVALSAIKPRGGLARLGGTDADDDDDADASRTAADNMTGEYTALLGRELGAAPAVACAQGLAAAGLRAPPTVAPAALCADAALAACLDALFARPPPPPTPARAPPTATEQRVHAGTAAAAAQTRAHELAALQDVLAARRRAVEQKRARACVPSPELGRDLIAQAATGAATSGLLRARVGSLCAAAQARALARVGARVAAPLQARWLAAQQARVQAMREALQRVRRAVEAQRARKAGLEAENHRLQCFLRDAAREPPARRRQLVAHLLGVAHDSLDEPSSASTASSASASASASAAAAAAPLCCDAGVQTLPAPVLAPVAPTGAGSDADEALCARLAEVCRAEDGWCAVACRPCRTATFVYAGGAVTLAVRLAEAAAPARFALGARAAALPAWLRAWLRAVVAAANAQLARPAAPDVLGTVRRAAAELAQCGRVHREVAHAAVRFPLRVELRAPGARASQVQAWALPQPCVTAVFASLDCRVAAVLARRRAGWALADLRVSWGQPASSREALTAVLSKSLTLTDVCSTVQRAVLA